MKAGSIPDKWQVFNITELVSVCPDAGSNFCITELNTKEGEGLLELLWGYLEVVVSVLVLEEALWVKSFSVNKEFEFLDNSCDIGLVSFIRGLLSIE